MVLTTQEDYRLKGFKKKKTYDAKGDVAIVEYYQDYDEGTGAFSNLKVKETRTVTRDSFIGVAQKVEVLIEWISGDGVTPRATKTLVKPLSSHDGMALNEESRRRLVEKAQGYLLTEVGLENTQEFGGDIIAEREAYIAGARTQIIAAIDASTRVYMTQARKDTLKAILDIDYSV